MGRLTQWFNRVLPSDPDALAGSRVGRWLGPRVRDKALWRMSRDTVAGGAALGAFFSIATPVAQIPAAVAAAVALRQNVPVAFAATFLNTPLTFGPVYYLCYQLGVFLTQGFGGAGVQGASEHVVAVITGVGFVSLAAAAGAYWAVVLAWRVQWRARWRLWRRRRELSRLEGPAA